MPRDAFGPLLRQLQAEMRSIRDENAMIRSAFTSAVSTLLDRIAVFEAHVDTRFDILAARLDQTERSVEERLMRIEARLTH